jgi:hypothetical protein
MTRDPRAAAMTEAELMEAIRALVAGLGLLAFHAHDGRKSWGPGFPDLVIVGRGGCIWRECKTESGSLSAEQRQWGDALKRAGQNWGTWRPTQLLDGSISRELAGLAAIQLELFGAAP